MNVLVFLDDNSGMAFNHRRQSRDKMLNKRLEEICTGHCIWMNEYSYKYYFDIGNTRRSESFLEEAEKDDFCLVETDHLKKFEDKIDKLIIFWWNRKYPSDVQFDLDLKDWNLISSKEFLGFSHDKITEEIYERRSRKS